MDITAAINYIQGLWLTIPEVRAAPNMPPDQLSAFPCAVTYEHTGEVTADKNYSWGPQTGLIKSELYVSNMDSPHAHAQLYQFRNAFLSAVVKDANLGGTVMIVHQVRWTREAAILGEVRLLRYTFEFDVSLELALAEE